MSERLVLASASAQPGAPRAAFLVGLALGLAALAAWIARWSARAWARRAPRPTRRSASAPLGPAVRGFLFRHFLGGVLLAALALALFALGAGVSNQQGSTVLLDKALAAGLHAWAGPRGLKFMLLVSALGAPAGMAVISALAALGLHRRDRALAWVWPVSFVVGQALDGTLKELYRRTRPVLADPFVHIPTYSFPSGHSVGVMVGLGMLAYTAARHVRPVLGRLAGVALCVACTLLVGFSRMYVGAHFYTDVLGGFLTGAVWLAVCVTGLEALREGGARRVGDPGAPDAREPRPTAR